MVERLPKYLNPAYIHNPTLPYKGDPLKNDVIIAEVNNRTVEYRPVRYGVFKVKLRIFVDDVLVDERDPTAGTDVAEFYFALRERAERVKEKRDDDKRAAIYKEMNHYG